MTGANFVVSIIFLQQESSSTKMWRVYSGRPEVNAETSQGTDMKRACDLIDFHSPTLTYPN